MSLGDDMNKKLTKEELESIRADVVAGAKVLGESSHPAVINMIRCLAKLLSHIAAVDGDVESGKSILKAYYEESDDEVIKLQALLKEKDGEIERLTCLRKDGERLIEGLFKDVCCRDGEVERLTTNLSDALEANENSLNLGLRAERDYLKQKVEELEGSMGYRILKKLKVENADQQALIDKIRETVIMPWQFLIDNGWSIVGMNHYRVDGKRHLFCSMVKDSRCITAESSDEQTVFENLHKQACTEGEDSK